MKRLGQKPSSLKVAQYSDNAEQKGGEQNQQQRVYRIDSSEKKILVGVDVFIHMNVKTAHEIASKIQKLNLHGLMLQTISSKGLKLWPSEQEFEVLSDHWCCRFMNQVEGEALRHRVIVDLLASLSGAGIDFIKVENLFEFDGKKGYTLAQGE